MIPMPLLVWDFPLTRPHAGVALGNGKQGLLIWGESSLLLTVARAGFWDRRGGSTIPEGTTFSKVREALLKKDEEELDRLFPKRKPGAPFPQQYGGGRLEIRFPDGLRPLSASLDLATGTVEVRVGLHEDDEHSRTLKVKQHPSEEICWIEADEDWVQSWHVCLHSAYDLVKDGEMGALDVSPPETWSNACGGGFVQRIPQGDSLAVVWDRLGGHVVLATELGVGVRAAICEVDFRAADAARRDYWSRYWESAARVTVPDEVVQRQFDYGLFRQAGLIRRDAPPATLQGPWMEDTRIPPWSNDYHFNINVELVYGAALATGQAREMQPLWDMLRSWMPRLRELGENFYQVPGAMILPHAVDDRCQMMGSFWAGAIDQACIAWMGRMAHQYYDFTGDETVLREVAWPLLIGAFEGFFAMLEEQGESYSLPVSVSPEFGGSDPQRCWGLDASFQLAALHTTIRSLRSLAPLVGVPEDPRWTDVAERLPHYSLSDATLGSYGWIGEPRKRIALWEGHDLTESHRHHSHLASIFPFCTIDPFDPTHQKVVARSLNHWNTLGAGNWTGWCVPWASIICLRCGLPDAALSWLHLLAEAFTNEGHATLHNADGAGVFGWDDGSLAWPDHRKGSDYLYHEVMQMDAAMGAVSAIIELLVSFRNGTVHIANRLPKGWRELSFYRVRVEGGFCLSGAYRHGRLEELTIVSSRGGALRLVADLGAGRTEPVVISTQAEETSHFRRSEQ